MKERYHKTRSALIRERLEPLCQIAAIKQQEHQWRFHLFEGLVRGATQIPTFPDDPPNSLIHEMRSSYGIYAGDYFFAYIHSHHLQRIYSSISKIINHDTSQSGTVDFYQLFQPYPIPWQPEFTYLFAEYIPRLKISAQAHATLEVLSALSLPEQPLDHFILQKVPSYASPVPDKFPHFHFRTNTPQVLFCLEYPEADQHPHSKLKIFDPTLPIDAPPFLTTP